MTVIMAKDKSNRVDYIGKTIFNKNLECLCSIFEGQGFKPFCVSILERRNTMRCFDT